MALKPLQHAALQYPQDNNAVFEVLCKQNVQVGFASCRALPYDVHRRMSETAASPVATG